MTTNDQSSRGAAATSADEIGIVFIAIAKDLRLCLICDGVFTRKAAAEHSDAVCHSPRPILISQTPSDLP